MKNKIIFMLVFIIICCCTLSCADRFNVKESGDWLYQEIGNNYCAIMGLSTEGKNKKTLVLPTNIDLNIVEYIGYQYGHQRSGNLDLSNSLCEKIYFNSSDISVHTEIIPSPLMIKVFIPNKNGLISRDAAKAFVTSSKSMIFLSKDYYEYNLQNNFIGKECFKGNIEYYLDDEDCFFVDNVENGKIEVMPPEPYKEGYKFDGWYNNDIEWDFVNNLVEDYLDENNRLRLEAKWISA